MIGEFIVAWNQAEMIMDLVVVVTLKVSMEMMKAMMSSPHVPSRADIMAAAVRERVTNQDVVADAEACAKKVKDLSNFRNDVVHGRWIQPVDEAGVPGAPVAGRETMATRTITSTQIQQKTAEVEKLTRKLADLNYRIIILTNPGVPTGPSPWHGKF